MNLISCVVVVTEEEKTRFGSLVGWINVPKYTRTKYYEMNNDL